MDWKTLNDTKALKSLASTQLPNILLVGGIASGKDTIAAEFAALEPGYDTFNIFHLGNYIRRHVDFLSPASGDAYQDSIIRRKLYQAYGQWARKNYGENVWNNITLYEMLLRLKDLEGKSEPFGFIIADGRQENEVSFWRSRGFKIVGVYASEEVRRTRMLARDKNADTSVFGHETEVSAAHIIGSGMCDYVISNNHELATSSVLPNLIKPCFDALSGEMKTSGPSPKKR